LKIGISIVVYSTDETTFQSCLQSLTLQNLDLIVSVVDHSPSGKYKSVCSNYNFVTYYDRREHNLGYGFGNNFGTKNFTDVDFIMIMNPDLILEANTLNDIINCFQTNPRNVGLFTGRIFYPNGEEQKLIKNYPNVFGLMSRRFSFLDRIPMFLQARQIYEATNFDYEKESSVEIISGCWMIFPSHVWFEINGFDPNYFLYFEDFDICLKTFKKGYSIKYYPAGKALHHYERGSSKSFKLFLVFIGSMIKFFNKWGWKWKE